jgi:hypothetical protein
LSDEIGEVRAMVAAGGLTGAAEEIVGPLG